MEGKRAGPQQVSDKSSIKSTDEGSDSTAQKSEMDTISAKTRRSYELVPAIGTRWRWYDVPYRILHWLLYLRRPTLAWRIRRLLTRGLNILLAFEHYDRLRSTSETTLWRIS